jgi:uncharacterized membrane protein YedE/YeeE
MRTLVTALVSGILFAVGLALSGMTAPGRVIGFLDVAGAWDPTLAFVMVGAIGVYAVAARTVPGQRVGLALKGGRVDLRLVAGAAVFGVGWGIAGLCPGPALVASGAGLAHALTFTAAMVAGMVVYRIVDVVRSRADEARSTEGGATC